MCQRYGHMDTGAISSQNFSVKGEDVGNEHFPILPMQMQFRGYSGTQCAHKLTRTPVLRGSLSWELEHGRIHLSCFCWSTGQLQAWCRELHTCVWNE